MTVGERIKSTRENKLISQIELANACNISKQSLYKYENNIITNIPSDKIELIAKRLGVTPAYLMGWEEPSQDNQYKINIKKKQLIDNYEKLNDKGKEKLIEYSDDLVSSKKYIKDKYVTVVKAARNKNGQHSIEKVQMTEEELSIFDIAPQSDEDL